MVLTDKDHNMSHIVRALLPHEERYAQIPNAFLRDERLSYKARGLLGTLLSHRPGWTVTMTSLRTATDGETAVRSAVRELQAAGYLIRERTRDDAGRITGWSWTLTDPHTCA